VSGITRVVGSPINIGAGRSACSPAAIGWVSGYSYRQAYAVSFVQTVGDSWNPNRYSVFYIKLVVPTLGINTYIYNSNCHSTSIPSPYPVAFIEDPADNNYIILFCVTGLALLRWKIHKSTGEVSTMGEVAYPPVLPDSLSTSWGYVMTRLLDVYSVIKLDDGQCLVPVGITQREGIATSENITILYYNQLSGKFMLWDTDYLYKFNYPGTKHKIGKLSKLSDFSMFDQNLELGDKNIFFGQVPLGPVTDPAFFNTHLFIYGNKIPIQAFKEYTG